MTSSSTDLTEAGDGSSASGRGGEPTVLPRGATLGRYVVLDRIGAGGMGVVYAAFDPELDRKVALKLLRVHEGGANRARLLHEARALARLNHPNVVALYDVGEHGDSLFLAMEFVAGHSLKAWLREGRTMREIVEVFVRAGQGLAAAHDEGLVHRDFKPDNVMVGDDGRVRVMDFGLARPREVIAHTPVAGTPAYMAPEVHGRRGVEASADQYSFCTALYEALYREHPFAGLSPTEMAAAALSGRIRTPPRGTKVGKGLRRVVVRGLARVPSERWPSMRDLLRALQRQVPGRRRLVVPGTAVVAVGLAAIAIPRLEAERTLGECEAEGARVDAVWNDDARARVRDALIGTAHPSAEQAAERVMPWLDRYSEQWRSTAVTACVHARIDRAREVDAGAIECLAEREDRLTALVDLLAAATPEMVVRAVPAAAELPAIEVCTDERAWSRRQSPPADATEAARSIRAQLAESTASFVAGAYVPAHQTAVAALADAEALDWPPLVAEASLAVGTAASHLGDPAAGESSWRAAVMAAGASGHDHVAAAAAMRLARHAGTSRLDPALAQLWTEQARMWLDRLGPGHDDLEAAFFDIRGDIAVAHARYHEARVDYQSALELRRRMLGPDHPITARSVFSVGNAYFEQHDFAAARTHFAEALAVYEATLGPDHPSVTDSVTGLAAVAYATGDFAAARAAFTRVHDVHVRTLGPAHRDAAHALVNLGLVDLLEGEHEAALERFERARAIAGANDPADSVALEALVDEGRVHLARGDYDRALAAFQRAFDLRAQKLGADNPRVGRTLAYIGRVHLERGELAEALARLEPALAMLEQRGAGPEVLAMARFATARALWSSGGDRARAQTLARTASESYRLAGEGWRRDREEVDAWLSAHANQ